MNVIFNLPLYAKIGLLLITLLALWLIFHDNSSDSPQLASELHRSSDYAMSDFTMTVMDINGEPSRVIQGDQMTHFPSDDSTEITNPVTEFIETGQDTWVITADHGHTEGKGETILLTGNVIITDKVNPAFKMLTEKLTLNTEFNTAYTKEPVKIHTPDGVTDSVGLHADLNDETINLHSRVKGQYDAPVN